MNNPVTPGECAAVETYTKLMLSAENDKAARAIQLPTEQDCIDIMVTARLRLKDLGWRDGCYAPKDGKSFTAIQFGYTGPTECKWFGSSFFSASAHDWWPIQISAYKEPL